MTVVIISYGVGTNSTAAIAGMVERGEPAPHAILSADPGGEWPQTYCYADIMSAWLADHGYPPITWVHRVDKNGDRLTLEQHSLDHKCLPAIAYGWRSCSDKFKIQPQEKWANNDPVCRAAWKRGELVTKIIGFHADEPQRAESVPIDDKKYHRRFPLIEWGWGQEECVAAIERAGLPQPGKSSCWFCPHMKPREIRELQATHPDLFARALAMEANAELTTVKGLGRSFSWRSIAEQPDLWPETYEREMPCACVG